MFGIIMVASLFLLSSRLPGYGLQCTFDEDCQQQEKGATCRLGTCRSLGANSTHCGIDSNCVACAGNGTCSACRDGFVLKANRCEPLPPCDPSRCSAHCCSDSNCVACACNGTCSACRDGFVLKANRCEPLPPCVDYCDPSRCSAHCCSDSNCVACAGDGTCSACRDGFVLKANRCEPLAPCVDYCDPSRCSAHCCSDSNCVACAGNGTCSACRDGFVLKANHCNRWTTPASLFTALVYPFSLFVLVLTALWWLRRPRSQHSNSGQPINWRRTASTASLENVVCALSNDDSRCLHSKNTLCISLLTAASTNPPALAAKGLTAVLSALIGEPAMIPQPCGPHQRDPLLCPVAQLYTADGRVHLVDANPPAAGSAGTTSRAFEVLACSVSEVLVVVTDATTVMEWKAPYTSDVEPACVIVVHLVSGSQRLPTSTADKLVKKVQLTNCVALMECADVASKYIPVLKHRNGGEVHVFWSEAATALNDATTAYIRCVLRDQLGARLAIGLSEALAEVHDDRQVVRCTSTGAFVVESRVNNSSTTTSAPPAAAGPLNAAASEPTVDVEWTLSVEDDWSVTSGETPDIQKAYVVAWHMTGLSDPVAEADLRRQLAWGEGIKLERCGRAAAETVSIVVMGPKRQRLRAYTKLQEHNVGESGAPVVVRVSPEGLVQVQFWPGQIDELEELRVADASESTQYVERGFAVKDGPTYVSDVHHRHGQLDDL